jgi:Tol biopolymer transport system component
MIRHTLVCRAIQRDDAASRAVSRAAALLSAALLFLAAAPQAADAQTFGRNKVNYETFDFRVLRSDRFDLHFYPAESLATADAARMADRWYTRLSAFTKHRFDRKPIILYADQPDFQQNNVTYIGGEGTGGVTEGFRQRVIMPFTGVYGDFNHVLGHELVHVFQYDMANAVGGMQGLNSLPLWLIEGMAEYLSVGREDPNTAMWLRDAARRNDVPSIKQLTNDPRYFPYRYGQALWAYVGGTWGDPSVVDLFRASLRYGFEPAIKRTLGISADSLSKQWAAAIRSTYLPVMAGRTAPDSTGIRVLGRGRRNGDMNVSPVVSPDGRYMSFYSSRGLFGIDLFVADAVTGRVIKQLGSPNADAHFTAISFINSAGSWSPDGKKLAYIVYAEGDHELDIFDVESREVERRVRVKGVGALQDPAWSPDGRSIAFSGSAGGISDLYLLDLASERVEQLTTGREAELQPAWSPDGRTLAFATDRGPGTNWELLTFGEMRLATIDVATRAVTPLPAFENAKHINPQYSADGRSLYFVSDADGVSDIYRLDLATSQPFRVTRVSTGISGISAYSPTMSVARQTGRILYSVFDNGGYSISRMEAEQTQGTPVTPGAGTVALAGVLPPPTSIVPSAVASYLADATTGLVSTPDYTVRSYNPKLRLDYVAPPSVGVGVGGFGGTQVGGGVAASFSDQLGNRSVTAVLQAQGDIKDIGGQLFYQNTKRRWNWGVGAGHIPYLTGFSSVRFVDVGGGVPGQLVETYLQRVYVDQASFITQYPLSTTRRVEFGVSGTRLAYGTELRSVLYVGNQVQEQRPQELPSPDPVYYAQGSAAFVGDYSNSGFTSPIAGGRYRFEVTPTVGTLNFNTLLGDYRRYFFARPFTFAVRGLHFGRYGKSAEDSTRLSPLFLGYETLVRGYAVESFDANECTGLNVSGICPEFERLRGSRLAVASAEFRIPLLGTEQLGLIRTRLVPVEIAPFFDAGVAWSSTQSPELRVDTRSPDRVPVFSAGVTARINVLGFAVLEAYYAYPFQRPEKGAHFGFQLAPGW